MVWCVTSKSSSKKLCANMIRTLNIDLHIKSPKYHVSGCVCSSMRTVGELINRMSRSAILRFMRNMFVEFLRSLVFSTTNGTKMFPRQPIISNKTQILVAVILKYNGNRCGSIMTSVDMAEADDGDGNPVPVRSLFINPLMLSLLDPFSSNGGKSTNGLSVNVSISIFFSSL